MTAWQMICSPVLLIPAHGKVYNTQEEMRADWEAGKNFKMYGSSYCSIRDIAKISADASSVTITDPRTRVNLKVA